MNELVTQVLDASNYARWNNPAMVVAAISMMVVAVVLSAFAVYHWSAKDGDGATAVWTVCLSLAIVLGLGITYPVSTGWANEKIPDEVRACVDGSTDGRTLESVRRCSTPLSEVPCLVEAFKSDRVWEVATRRDKGEVRGAVIDVVDRCEGWGSEPTE